jgi:hypothetical protein
LAWKGASEAEVGHVVRVDQVEGRVVVALVETLAPVGAVLELAGAELELVEEVLAGAGLVEEGLVEEAPTGIVREALASFLRVAVTCPVESASAGLRVLEEVRAEESWM